MVFVERYPRLQRIQHTVIIAYAKEKSYGKPVNNTSKVALEISCKKHLAENPNTFPLCPRVSFYPQAGGT